MRLLLPALAPTSLCLRAVWHRSQVWQSRLLDLWRGCGIEGCIEWEMLFLLLFKRLAKVRGGGFRSAAHARASPGALGATRVARGAKDPLEVGVALCARRRRGAWMRGNTI